VLFRQRRYGLSGRQIYVWKYRTMTVCEDDAQVTQAKRGDQRVTRLGTWLRRTSLDELPQLFNVMEGTMSLVGPRPHAVAHNELYRSQIHGYMLRHKVKPGITGWAQVNGWRGETDTLRKMEKRIEHDLYYIHHWGIGLDLKILFLTVFGRRVRQNAY
jgi:putative colanic acid biosynthesis UDP-glucose lipid carrier transferase